MSSSLIFCICLAYFVAAYFTYGRFLGGVLGIDKNRPTPAHTQYDGVDYVPTHKVVLFGHHFASIAGPGPIVGPIVAAYFGWLPALIWILIGCVFVGAFHDFAALVISARNRGRSISFVMERLLGLWGRQLFLAFCLLCLVLIVAVFTNLIADLFTKVPAVTTSSLFFIALAPLFALVTNCTGMRILHASLIFVPLVYLSVWVGASYPLDVRVMFGLSEAGTKSLWLCVLAVYILCASIVPVQWLLQPRDYLNSWLLYGMLALGFCAIVAGNPEIQMDSFRGFESVMADGSVTALVPALFILIACGACSGFHALVASGTTSKQIDNEKDMLPIGYGAMLLEGVLGVMALVAVMSMSPDTFVEMGKNPTVAFANGISAISAAIGCNVEYAKIFISLAIAAFMMTSLDTATRLGRFLFQEIFMPRSRELDSDTDRASERSRETLSGFRRVLTSKYLASLLIVSVSVLMAFSGEAAALWPIFGASNQLMAALTFLVIALWLLTRGSKWYLAFVPMVFMIVMSLWGLIQVVQQQFVRNNYVLVTAGIFLCLMSVMMIMMGVSVIAHHLRGRVGSGQSQPV